MWTVRHGEAFPRLVMLIEGIDLSNIVPGHDELICFPDPCGAPSRVFDHIGVNAIALAREPLVRRARIRQVPDTLPAFVQPPGAGPPPVLDE